MGFDKKAVSMKEIEMLALRVKSIHMLMLFDSCFSGSLFSMKRAAPVDVSEKSANPVRQFITAGTAEEPVPDKSVFKICLLQGLDGYADYNKDSYITGSELGMYLQTKVINYSRGVQHPQYGKINNPLLDKGDFIFALEGDAKEKAKSLEEEPPKLAYIPKTVTAPMISLRKESLMISGENKLKEMLVEYNFFDKSRNFNGTFDNDFVDNTDGTVIDRATGLMWQKSGSLNHLDFMGAERYIKRLNKERFAGYSDWRMPTIEELASLLEKNKKSDAHIDPVFDKQQGRYWSSDKRFELDGGHYGGWIVSFSDGIIMPTKSASDRTIRHGWARPWNDNNYVRAVRSVK
jgi:hypothetical protein